MKKIVVFGILVLFLFACGAPQEKKPAYDISAEFQKLDAAHKELQDLRQQIGEVEKKIEILEDAKKHRKKYKKEELPEEDLATLQVQRDETKKQLDTKYDAFMDNLTMFLNKAVNEFPDKVETLKAKRIYSDENILIAREYIEKAGDYKKAEEIIKQALQIDPDYDKLTEELKYIHDWRYITKERFDQVKKGMTMEKVKEICGYPNKKFIQEKKTKRGTITAWYYPKEDKSATGVYFLNGKVYKTEWKIKEK